MYTTPKPISNGQIRMIYGLAKRLTIDNDWLHDIVEDKTGKTSIKELTSFQAKLVTDHLQRLLGEEPQTPPNRPTEKQALSDIFSSSLSVNSNPK